MREKDEGLKLCIDYRTLNAQTIKVRYLLPLVPGALEQLQGAPSWTCGVLITSFEYMRVMSRKPLS